MFNANMKLPNRQGGWIGTAISVAGSIYGAAKGSDAAEGAAGDANAGQMAAMEELKAADERTRRDTSPYRNLGAGGADRLSFLLGLDDEGGRGQQYTLDDFKKQQRANAVREGLSGKPLEENVEQFANEMYQKYLNGELGNDLAVDKRFGQFNNLEDRSGQEGYGSLLKKFGQSDLDSDLVYQNGLKFGLDEGEKAIDNRARSMGGYDSGSVLKALTRFGNDYATTKTAGAYDRFNTDKNSVYNMLTGATNTGMGAVNTSANSGTAIGQSLAGAQGSMGLNNAAGRVGSANAWGNAIGGVTDALGGIDWKGLLGGSKGGGNASPGIQW